MHPFCAESSSRGYINEARLHAGTRLEFASADHKQQVETVEVTVSPTKEARLKKLQTQKAASNLLHLFILTQ